MTDTKEQLKQERDRRMDTAINLGYRTGCLLRRK